MLTRAGVAKRAHPLRGVAAAHGDRDSVRANGVTRNMGKGTLRRIIGTTVQPWYDPQLVTASGSVRKSL